MAITLQSLREKLVQERARLLEEIDSLSYIHSDGLGTTTENDHYSNHIADVATETFEEEKGLALEWNLRRLLQETEDALRKFEQGTYGICANCGRPIPLERLEALPHATLCVQCKRLQEARH